MNDARANLIAALDEEHNPSYWGADTRDSIALVNAFAHQLAEQQRHHFGTGDSPVKSHCATDCNFCRGVSAAADLIDPEWNSA